MLCLCPACSSTPPQGSIQTMGENPPVTCWVVWSISCLTKYSSFYKIHKCCSFQWRYRGTSWKCRHRWRCLSEWRALIPDKNANTSLWSCWSCGLSRRGWDVLLPSCPTGWGYFHLHSLLLFLTQQIVLSLLWPLLPALSSAQEGAVIPTQMITIPVVTKAQWPGGLAYTKWSQKEWECLSYCNVRV